MRLSFLLSGIVFSGLLTLAPLVLPAQSSLQHAALLIPAELQKNANAVIRNQEVEFYVKSPGEATFREKRTVTLFNDKSNYDVLVVNYNTYNKLGKITGKIYDNSGKLIREIDKKEVKDVSAISDFSMYEDDRIRYVDVDHTEYPYTVEFEYEMTYKHLLDYPNWNVANYHTAVQRSVFILDLPEFFQVSVKLLNLDALAKEETAKGRRRMIWTVENLPAIKYEPYSPPASELLPGMLVSPHLFKAENYSGSMASWKDFGDFMNLLMKDRDLLSPSMKEKVKALTLNAANDRDKVEILYRYLQGNMRYVSVQLGIGGWQPFDAQYVENRKYGDCKALSNFMKALLKEAGITAWPVLIFNGNAPYEITEDFATPAFNHMILHVPSENCWLECTSSDYPANYIGSSNSNRKVLLITETGGKLGHTPEMPTTANFEGNEVRIDLQTSGAASIEVSSVRQGAKHEWYRSAARHYSKEDLQKEFQAASSLPSFTIESLAVRPQESTPEARINYKVLVPRYASKAGKRLFIPLNAVNPFTDIPPAIEERNHPVFVGEGYMEEDRIEMKLPEGYSLESIPNENVLHESVFGNYSLKVNQTESMVIIQRHLEIRPVRLPAEEYNALRNYFKEIAKTDGAKLVLVEKKN